MDLSPNKNNTNLVHLNEENTDCVSNEMEYFLTNPTQDTQPSYSSDALSLVDPPANEQPWGVLLNTVESGSAITLLKKEFVAGRGHNEIPVNTSNILPKIDYEFPKSTKDWCQISRTHFKLMLEMVEGLALPKITDLSSNGTFINKELLGRSNSLILNNNDVISVANPNNTVFIFIHVEKTQLINIPTVISNSYFVAKHIGSGGYGKVYLTLKKSNGAKLAMKVIETDKRHATLDPFQEPAIMRTINHENVVKIVDVVVLDNTFFLFLEYMAGGNLFDFIQQRKFLTEDMAKHIILQLMLGLHHLHTKNIVHRDIKPLNILLSDKTDFPILKITDFGLSRKLRRAVSDMHTLCGTISFSPPEMIAGNTKYFDCRWDIWSAGIITYLCLSGQLPFRQKPNDRKSIQQQICTSLLVFRPADRWKPYLQHPVIPLLNRMLAKEFINRPRAIDVIGNMWFKGDQELLKRLRIPFVKENVAPVKASSPPRHSYIKRLKR